MELEKEQQATRHLSHTSISLYEQCGERYRLQKIEHVPQPPAPALILGIAVHEVLELDGRARMQEVTRETTQVPQEAGGGRTTGGIEPLELQVRFLSAFSEALHAQDPLHILTAQEQQLLIDRGLSIVRAYSERVAPTFHPVAIEETFEQALAPGDPQRKHWTFTGRRDARTLALQSDGRRVPTTVDFKTATKPWPPGKEHGDGQPTAYAWGDLIEGRPISEQFTFLVFVTSVPPDYREADDIAVQLDVRRTTRTGEDVRVYQAKALHVAAAIDAGRFEANPSPLCAWCGCLASCAIGRHWLQQQNRQPQPEIARFLARQ